MRARHGTAAQPQAPPGGEDPPRGEAPQATGSHAGAEASSSPAPALARSRWGHEPALRVLAGHWDTVVMVLVAVALATAKLRAFTGVTPHYSGDEGVFEANGYTLATTWRFWLGTRPLAVPRLHAWADFEPERVVWLQFYLETVAWTALAAAASRFVRRGAPRVLAFGAALALFLVEVDTWAFTVRSESLAHASLAAVLAAALWAIAAPSARSLARRAPALLGVAVLGCATRDTFFVVPLLAAIALPLGVLVVRRSWTRSTRTLVASVAVAAGLAGVAALAQVVTARAHRHVYPLTNVVFQRVLGDSEKRAWFVRRGMPLNAAIRSRRGKFFSSDDWLIYQQERRGDFGAFNQWVRRSGPGTYRQWLLEHPGEAWAAALAELAPLATVELDAYLAKPPAATFEQWRDRVRAAAPTRVAPVTALACAAGVAAAVLLLVRRRRARGLAWGVGLAVASLVATTFVVVHGDAMEVARHGAAVAVLGTTTCALTLALLIDLAAAHVDRLSWLTRGAAARRGASAREGLRQVPRATLRAARRLAPLAGALVLGAVLAVGVRFAGDQSKYVNVAPLAEESGEPADVDLARVRDGDVWGPPPASLRARPSSGSWSDRWRAGASPCSSTPVANNAPSWS